MALAILYTFAQNSETITNSGSGGSSGNGQANFSGWHATNGNGAPYPWYGLFTPGAVINIPNTSYNSSGTGAFIHSWEIGFWLNGAGNSAIQRIYDKAWGGFSIQIQSGYLMFIRATANSGSYVYWQATTTPLSAGHTYYIQVAVNLPANPQSCTAGNVSMRIGTNLGAPVQQAQNAPVKYNAATSWYNDSGAAALGNCSAGCTGYNCNCGVMIYREFNGEAKNWATYSDWSADVVRWNPAVATTISCNPSTLTPTLGTVYSVTGTLQTTSGTKLANKPLTVWYTTDEQTWHSTANGWIYTDSNGNYSYNQTAIALEDEYVVFEGDAGHDNCVSPIFKSRGQKIPTTITMNPSGTTIPVGTQFTLSGWLSAMGMGLANTGVRFWTGTSQSGPWTPTGGTIAATTSSNGDYTIVVTAVAGTTWYGTSYDGDATHLAASNSPNSIAITGGSTDQTVNAISPPDMETSVLPLYIEGDWTVSPLVVPAMEASAGPNPTLTIGYTITTSVVGMEIATVIVYPDVEHIWEFCFPAVATGSELRARPLIVSQLSTHVNTEVVGDCIIETQNYTGIQESETVTTFVVPAMEMKVVNPYAKIAFQEIINLKSTLVDELDVTSTLTNMIDLVAVVTDEVDLELEVEYE